MEIFAKTSKIEFEYELGVNFFNKTVQKGNFLLH